MIADSSCTVLTQSNEERVRLVAVRCLMTRRRHEEYEIVLRTPARAEVARVVRAHVHLKAGVPIIGGRVRSASRQVSVGNGRASRPWGLPRRGERRSPHPAPTLGCCYLQRDASTRESRADPISPLRISDPSASRTVAAPEYRSQWIRYPGRHLVQRSANARHAANMPSSRNRRRT